MLDSLDWPHICKLMKSAREADGQSEEYTEWVWKHSIDVSKISKVRVSHWNYFSTKLDAIPHIHTHTHTQRLNGIIDIGNVFMQKNMYTRFHMNIDILTLSHKSFFMIMTFSSREVWKEQLNEWAASQLVHSWINMENLPYEILCCIEIKLNWSLSFGLQQHPKYSFFVGLSGKHKHRLKWRICWCVCVWVSE